MIRSVGPWVWMLVGLGALMAAEAAIVLVLLACGRRSDARALAGFVPDCVVLLARLVRDPRVPRRTKLLLGALIAYLALPFDLVPDPLPVIGQLDDAIFVALALRAVVRAAGDDVVAAHWPGPEITLRHVLRLAGLPREGAGAPRRR